MPVKVAKKGEKFRVVESRTGKIATRDGTPIDGGGHVSRARAVKQVQAVNLAMRRAAGKKAPPRRK